VPYSSKAQQAFFHTASAKKAGISESTVKDFDDATKGKYGKLPEHVKSVKTKTKVKKK
jgi:hypothetical protein